MSNPTMLAAFCCGYEHCQDSSSRFLAKHELKRCVRPSLRSSHRMQNDSTCTCDDSTSNDASSYCYPPGTVLIQTLAASICGSDLFGIGGCTASPNWRRPTDLLVAMQGRCGGSGHEVIGTIVDMVPSPPSSPSQSVASRIDETKNESLVLGIGTKVLAMPLAYLYKVQSMRSLFERQSGTKLEEVFPEETGAFCEYFITHSCVCLPLPETVPREGFDYRWYVMAQPLGTVLHACQKLGSVINQTVAIVGQGQNGLIMSQMLASMGARRIIALDLLEERLVYSKRNGATHTVCVKIPMDMEDIRKDVAEITIGQMCDVTIDMVGHQNKTITLCSDLTKSGGKVLLFGLPPAREEDQMSIRYVDLTRSLQYLCSHSPAFESFRLALELIEQGRFDPSSIFSDEISFRDFVNAYDQACNYRDGVVKVLLTFTGEDMLM